MIISLILDIYLIYYCSAKNHKLSKFIKLICKLSMSA